MSNSTKKTAKNVQKVDKEALKLSKKHKKEAISGGKIVTK